MTQRFTTGDPLFDPRQPVTVNGYVFAPVGPIAKAAGELLRSGRYMTAIDRELIADMLDPPGPTGWPSARPVPDMPRGARRYVAPPRPGFASGYTAEELRNGGANCGERTEGDEKVCPACGLRWSVKEEKPPCPR